MDMQTVMALLVTMTVSAGTVRAGELTVGSAQTQPGQTVSVPVTYDPGSGRTAAALATDVRFDGKALKNPRCQAGSALSGGNAPKAVKCAVPRTGVLRLAVYGLNTEPVPAGELASISFDVAADAHPHSYKLRQKPSAADAAGKDFLLKHRNGVIQVGTAAP